MSKLAYMKAGATAEWLGEHYVLPYVKKRAIPVIKRTGQNMGRKYYENVRKNHLLRMRPPMRRRLLAKRDVDFGNFPMGANKKGRFSRTPIGAPVGAKTTKTHVQETVTALLDTRSFHSREVTLIAKGDSVSERERLAINIRGVQIKFNIYQRSKALGGRFEPLLVNYCLVSPKGGQGSLNTIDWFRSQDNNDKRTVSFSDQLTSTDMHGLPINTDNYTVLLHKRFSLLPSEGGTENSYKLCKSWVPVNRQVAYASLASTSCQNPIYLVYWACHLNDPGGTVAGINGMNIQFKTTTYFKDPGQD